jgi:hypothetical protein
VGKMSILSMYVVHMTPLAAVRYDCQNSAQTRINKVEKTMFSTEDQLSSPLADRHSTQH